MHRIYLPPCLYIYAWRAYWHLGGCCSSFFVDQAAWNLLHPVATVHSAVTCGITRSFRRTMLRLARWDAVSICGSMVVAVCRSVRFLVTPPMSPAESKAVAQFGLETEIVDQDTHRPQLRLVKLCMAEVRAMHFSRRAVTVAAAAGMLQQACRLLYKLVRHTSRYHIKGQEHLALETLTHLATFPHGILQKQETNA